MNLTRVEPDRTSQSPEDVIERPAVHIQPRPHARIELALRVKNEEATLGERLRQATRLLESLDESTCMVVVDCGSVDHSVEIALSLTGRVPVRVISCSETTVGWMAAAASTSSAETVAFASATERIYLLAHTRLLVGERALVVATTEEVPHFRFLYPHRPTSAAPGDGAHGGARIQLLHMDTVSAASLFAAEPRLNTLRAAMQCAIAHAVVVRELRIYEPSRLRLKPRATHGGWRTAPALG